MPREAREGELRCFCSRKPLLGKYGRDKNGLLYVHVRVYKQDRIYGEIIIEGGGSVRILCRECRRWHKVTIRQPQSLQFVVEELPETLKV